MIMMKMKLKWEKLEAQKALNKAEKEKGVRDRDRDREAANKWNVGVFFGCEF